jgi:hypothetical protein
VVPGDRHRVEVPHFVVDEELLNVAHHAQSELGAEDAGILRLIFLENVGLHGAAHDLEGVGADAFVGLSIDHFVAGDAEQREPEAVVAVRQRSVILRPHAIAEVIGDRRLRRFPAR